MKKLNLIFALLLVVGFLVAPSCNGCNTAPQEETMEEEDESSEDFEDEDTEDLEMELDSMDIDSMELDETPE